MFVRGLLYFSHELLPIIGKDCSAIAYHTHGGLLVWFYHAKKPNTYVGKAITTLRVLSSDWVVSIHHPIRDEPIA